MYPYELNFSPDEVIVYLRKSRSDDPSLTVEEVLSKHETILNEWSEKHLGALVPEENKYREVVSGETIADRPEIKEVLRRIESPRIKALLVVEVQRISRGDLEDAGRLMKLLRYTNTVVITPPKTYDLQDEYDREFFERELKRGNEFLEYQKKIMNRGRLLSVQQGNFVGNCAPYGYEKTFYMDGKRKCHTLKIKEDEANIVRLIFDLYVNQDMGRIQIAHYLDDLHIKPPRGEYWSAASLRDLLENVHYIGKIKWNHRKSVLNVADSEIISSRPKAKYGDYIIVDGKHEAIVSEEIFFAAMEKHGHNTRTKSSCALTNPLAGLLYCQCGRAMVLRKYTKQGKERSSPRLLCPNQTHCHTASCLFDELMERVVDILRQNIEDIEIQLQHFDNNASDTYANLIRHLENQLKELERKEISQWEKYSEEAMPRQIFEQLNAKVLKDKEHTQAALLKARQSAPNIADYQQQLTRFQDALNALLDPDAPVERKNTLLKQCIARIDYRRSSGQQITRQMAGGKSILDCGAHWTSHPIELEVTLRSSL